jgi:hypothetical protein
MHWAAVASRIHSSLHQPHEISSRRWIESQWVIGKSCAGSRHGLPHFLRSIPDDLKITLESQHGIIRGFTCQKPDLGLILHALPIFRSA